MELDFLNIVCQYPVLNSLADECFYISTNDRNRIFVINKIYYNLCLVHPKLYKNRDVLKKMVVMFQEISNIEKKNDKYYLQHSYFDFNESKIIYTSKIDAEMLNNVREIYLYDVPVPKYEKELRKIFKKLQNINHISINRIDIKDIFIPVSVHSLNCNSLLQIANIHMLHNLRTFSLWEPTRSIDIDKLKILSRLTNLKSVILYQTDICDVSMFGHLHKLDVTMTDVKDVSMLGNLHTLDCCMTDVKDVSMLGKLHTLNCSSTNITDVSMLGNLHCLNIRNTIVTDVSMLGNLHCLNIINTKVADISMLKNIHRIEISKDMKNIKGADMKNVRIY